MSNTEIRYLLLTYGNESSLEAAKSLLKYNNAVLFGCHYDTDNPGQVYLNSKYIFTVPNPFIADHEIHSFFSRLNDIIADNRITYALITNCKVLRLISENVVDLPNYPSLERALSLYRFTPEASTKYGNEDIFVDKLEMHKRFPNISPKLYDHLNINDVNDDTVLVGKYRFGTSSEKMELATKAEFLTKSVLTHYMYNHEYFICEYLPGEEVTVDCVTFDSKVYDYSVRIRHATREGISTVSKIANQQIYNEIEPYIAEIYHTIKPIGIWFAQFKRDASGKFKLLEINHRISGSLPAAKLVNKDYVAVMHQHLSGMQAFSGFNYSFINNANKSGKDKVLYRHFNTLEKNVDQYVVDLDGTLVTETHGQYSLAQPIHENINKINGLYKQGARIIIHSARGMKRYNNDVAEVYKQYYEMTINQLHKFGILYTTLMLGKPWGIPVDNDAKTIGTL